MASDSKPATSGAARKAERRAQMLAEQQAQRARQARNRKLRLSAIVAVALIALTGGLYAVFKHSNSAATYSYAAGSPGVGQVAPGFDLAATTGGSISLAQFKGKTVLLYFQEGLDCQPCWTQLTDLQNNTSEIKAAGIDQIVSITTDPVNLLTQRTTDMHLGIPVLSDPNLTVSTTYNANQYGMMGTSADGHTFILVGPTGTIEWRADYGGAPNYTMDVPVSTLLSQLKAGEKT
jgi:peroxiredoxin Q/BCP